RLDSGGPRFWHTTIRAVAHTQTMPTNARRGYAGFSPDLKRPARPSRARAADLRFISSDDRVIPRPMAGRAPQAMVGLAMVAMALWPANASAVSSSPASSWQTNGRVRAIAVGAHKIFIGGDFTRVRAPGSSSGGAVRNHLAALSLATGRLMPWNPGANGTV